MKRFSLIISILACLLMTRGASAQQDAMFTQYMFNGLSLNPAYAGSHNAISTNFIWRKQWVGLDGAPTSTNFSIHSPLGGDKLAGGVQLVHDKIGVSEELFVNGSLAYILPVSDDAKLSFGLSGGLDKLDYNFNDLELGSTVDPNFVEANNISESKVNFGLGVYYHTKNTFVGLSIPRLIENAYGNEGLTYQQRRHYFIYAGHVFTLHPNFKFKPNVLVKVSTNVPASVDLNANFLFIDKVWFGVSYRSSESIDLLAQYYVTDQLSFGYAYDINTNRLRTTNNGSHEVMLSYLFSFRKNAMLTPRYF